MASREEPLPSSLGKGLLLSRGRAPKKSSKAAEIEAKKAGLEKLKGTGSTGMALKLIREIEALESE